jgi:hypothetical protein
MVLAGAFRPVLGKVSTRSYRRFLLVSMFLFLICIYIKYLILSPYNFIYMIAYIYHGGFIMSETTIELISKMLGSISDGTIGVVVSCVLT